MDSSLPPSSPCFKEANDSDAWDVLDGAKEELESLDDIFLDEKDGEGSFSLTWSCSKNSNGAPRILGVMAVSPLIDQRPLTITCPSRVAAALELSKRAQVNALNPRNVDYTISFLPPLTIRFELTADYPDKSGPHYSLEASYLANEQLERVCSSLNDLWETFGTCLFSWIEFIQHEVLDSLGITSHLPISVSVPDGSMRQQAVNTPRKNGSVPHAPQTAVTTITTTTTTPPTTAKAHVPSELMTINGEKGHSVEERAVTLAEHQPQSPEHKVTEMQLGGTAKQTATSTMELLQSLLEYDMKIEPLHFKNSSMSCPICIGLFQGADCFKLCTCGHVFCKACLSGYFSSKIGSAEHKFVCPAIDCCVMPVPTDVVQLVEPHLFAKYDEALVAIALSEMGDVVPCPRKSCQKPVILETDSALASCRACDYNFCAHCSKAYHGEDGCQIKAFEELLARFEVADDEEKLRLEKRYGKERLRKAREEAASAKYLRQETCPCPSCGQHIIKTHGCNKMTCGACNSHFCYLCRTKISGYEHFQRGHCFGRLFEGIISDEEEEEEVDVHRGNHNDDFRLALWF